MRSTNSPNDLQINKYLEICLCHKHIALHLWPKIYLFANMKQIQLHKTLHVQQTMSFLINIVKTYRRYKVRTEKKCKCLGLTHFNKFVVLSPGVD